MVAGWAILIFVVVAYTVIELIPIGTLTGVLFIVIINTFYWESIPMLFYRKGKILRNTK